MNCPHCNAAFETSDELLQHFADSPGCFLCTVSMAGMAGRSGNRPLSSSAADSQLSQLSVGTVIARRSLLIAGAVVVAVSMAMSAAVTVWINSRGGPQKIEETKVHSQPKPLPQNVQVAIVSNSTALAAASVQSVQVVTSALPASVAYVLTNPVSKISNAATNTTLNLTLSSPKIHLGESVTLTIEINGVDEGVASPELSSLPPADVLFLGQHSNSRSSITIINGHMTRDTLKGRVFLYKITPCFPGAYRTGPVRVIAEGKLYTHPGVSAEVVCGSGT